MCKSKKIERYYIVHMNTGAYCEIIEEGWSLPLEIMPPGEVAINTSPDKKLYK